MKKIAVMGLIALFARAAWAQETPPKFKVLAVTSRAKDHLKMIAAATPMLEKMARENNFAIDITDDATVVNDENLARYQVFVQLQEAPFDLSSDQQQALQKFIEQGLGNCTAFGTSRPSDRSDRLPRSTPIVPWRIGAWPWRTSTTASGLRS